MSRHDWNEPVWVWFLQFAHHKQSWSRGSMCLQVNVHCCYKSCGNSGQKDVTILLFQDSHRVTADSCSHKDRKLIQILGLKVCPGGVQSNTSLWKLQSNRLQSPSAHFLAGFLMLLYHLSVILLAPSLHSQSLCIINTHMWKTKVLLSRRWSSVTLSLKYSC